ncbi:MAG: beta-ketoacyl synthase N-terminal-like domain-containing protein, partial [Acidobacteriota bacterium]
MSGRAPNNSPVAIIGMACTYPGARNATQFWQNIVGKVDSISEVEPARWDPAVFYNPDPAAEGRVYCKKGGWMDGTYAFNPRKYGIMPSALEGTEADHFLVLRTAHEALEDAGYENGRMDGNRAGIILGKGNYTGPGVTALMYRSIVAEQILAILKGLHPEFSEHDIGRLKAAVRDTVPALTPEGAAGLIPNICTGRVANRLGLMGRNFTVDAACASSLIATEIAVQDLRTGQLDLVLAGGVHVFAHIPFLLVFDAMRALSLGSTIRPFDEECDGTMSGEGVGILALKRLEDAERDGDRIYAIIRGCGSSSDGRAKGIVAPRQEGEELALRRALENSGIRADSIELIEAHGTGTPAGDAAEVEALRRVWGENEKLGATCAIGTVKSMIGHAMPAAGAAGLIKAALALYHAVLPPTLHCSKPRAALVREGSPFYVNSETRPWVHSPATPRRAGVNAFGFGGINAHVVLEEYTGARQDPGASLLRDWQSEFITLRAATREGLVEAAERLRTYASHAEGVALRDIAFTLNSRLHSPGREENEQLTIVAASSEDLRDKLGQAQARLQEARGRSLDIKDRQGIYCFQDPELRRGKVAFLFPGEGSQYLNMLSELCLHFPAVRRVLDQADAANSDPARRPASSLIFPP